MENVRVQKVNRLETAGGEEQQLAVFFLPPSLNRAQTRQVPISKQDSRSFFASG